MNSSTFRTIGVLFPTEEAGPVLGGLSAIASYGAFIVPAMVGIAIKDGYLQIIFYCLGGYYISCGLLNLWYYFRPGAEKLGVLKKLVPWRNTIISSCVINLKCFN